jgi:16S rRNA U1498 N3-methylase RsmE
MPASLGPRILRAETAPIAALAALMYELEAAS